MSWSGNEIVFGQGGGGIMRVDAKSGKPERVAHVQSGEFAFGPQILPGGRGVLFSLSKGVALDCWTAAPSSSSHSVPASGLP